MPTQISKGIVINYFAAVCTLMTLTWDIWYKHEEIKLCLERINPVLMPISAILQPDIVAKGRLLQHLLWNFLYKNKKFFLRSLL